MLRIPISVANNLKKASVVSFRCLSTQTPSPKASSSSSKSKAKDNTKEVASKPVSVSIPTAPRNLPTRHSRHHKPIAAPQDVLETSYQEIVASIPGTLFAYDSKNLHHSKVEEYEQALQECHPLQQKVEYLLRGYSALLSGSIVNLQNVNDDDVSGSSNGDEIIEKMRTLLERMEVEGKTYVELRSKFRIQHAKTTKQSKKVDKSSMFSVAGVDVDMYDDDVDVDTDDDTDSDAKGEGDSDADAWRLKSLISNYGTPPGPTVTMYDLILDAIAVSISSSKDPLGLLKASRELHSRAIQRHNLDVKGGVDGLNPSSCPTAMTFNALIRGAVSVSGTKSDEVRDYAIENGFFAFNNMFHHDVVHRNSSTYKNLFDMISGHFPVGAMRGNIAAGIWEKAVQDKVVDLSVFKAMSNLGNLKHGQIFDEWWKKVEGNFKQDANGYGLPMVWGKNKNVRRFDKRFDTY